MRTYTHTPQPAFHEDKLLVLQLPARLPLKAKKGKRKGDAGPKGRGKARAGAPPTANPLQAQLPCPSGPYVLTRVLMASCVPARDSPTICTGITDCLSSCGATVLVE